MRYGDRLRSDSRGDVTGGGHGSASLKNGGYMDFLWGITTFWGLFVSLLEERFGRFQDLTPGQKQAVNAALTFFLPLVVAFAGSYIDPKYKNVNQDAILYLLMVLAPVLCYAASQMAHGIDKWLQGKLQ